jgi:hypothetical protein
MSGHHRTIISAHITSTLITISKNMTIKFQKIRQTSNKMKFKSKNQDQYHKECKEYEIKIQ